MGAYFREDLLSEGYSRLRFGGLFSGGLIIGRIFASEIWGLFSGGLIIGRIFASEIWGAYFREDLLSEGYLRLRFGGLIFGRTYYRKDICV